MVSIKTTIINITLSYRCQASTLRLLEADGSEHRRVFRGQLAIVSLPTRGEFNIRKTEQNCVNGFFCRAMIQYSYDIWRVSWSIQRNEKNSSMEEQLHFWRWIVCSMWLLNFSICFAICICIWFEIVFIFVFLRAGDLNAMVVHCFESAVTHWRTRRGRTCHVLFWTHLHNFEHFWTLGGCAIVLNAALGFPSMCTRMRIICKRSVNGATPLQLQPKWPICTS